MDKRIQSYKLSTVYLVYLKYLSFSLCIHSFIYPEILTAVFFIRSFLFFPALYFLKNYGVLAIPTVPGPPPEVNMEVVTLEEFRTRAFCLLSLAGMSRFCHVFEFISFIGIQGYM